MNKALIRTLYGDNNNPIHDSRGSRSRIEKDIKNTLSNNPLQESFYTYAFGESNYKILESLGCKNIVLASREPWFLGGPGYFWNKIVAWDYAMQDFDEIVYLDWDTALVKPFPDNFWDVLSAKREIQSPIYKCHKETVTGRNYIRGDNKRGASGAFVYIRDKSAPKEILKLTKDPILLSHRNSFSDELFLSKYMDNISGGWKGQDNYFKLFEPPWCILEHSIFLDDKKDACFRHPVKGR